MRAAELREAGSAPVLAERDRPTGDTVVEVLAAPITPLDLLCATGTSYFGRPACPYVPGVQGVGRIDGHLVWFPTSAGMKPGDGSMAEYAVATEVVPLPDGTEPAGFAALGLSALAAYMALTWRGELAAGEQVIVLGAGGVVGQAAVQLARLAGAHRVIAAARSTGAQHRAAGADAVVVLDTDDVAVLADRFAAAADGPVDLVLDPLFGPAAAGAAKSLRPGGRLVNLGGSAAETCPLDSGTLRGKSLRVLGYTNNELTAEQRADAIGVLAGHALAGELSVTHEVVPLTDVESAWQRQRDGQASGRIVLRPS